MVSGQKYEMYDSMKQYAREREIPPIFSGLSEARDLLVSHWHVASYSISNTWDLANGKLLMVPQAGAWQKESMSILARWSSAYDAYLNIQGNNLTDKRRKGTAALYILKELGSVSMMLTRTRVDNQRDWDIFCPTFQKIVSLAADIIEVDIKSTVGKRTSCFDMALVRPLFKVCFILSIYFPCLEHSRVVSD